MTPFDALITEARIRARVRKMGEEISHAYAGKDLVVAGVLKGAFIFMADLVRSVSVPLHCDFLRVSSYENNKSTGNIRIDFDLTQPVEGQHVLLVEDIVDSGRTLRFLIDHLKAKKPASLKVCSLLYKEIDPSVRPLIDYLGFTVPKEYVVGYGMDAEGLYRSLPEIRAFRNKSAQRR
jgi:hypoxanthine phosphoribosyltransferase